MAFHIACFSRRPGRVDFFYGFCVCCDSRLPQLPLLSESWFLFCCCCFFFSIDCFQIRYEEFGKSFFQMLSVDFGLEDLDDSNSVVSTEACG